MTTGAKDVPADAPSKTERRAHLVGLCLQGLVLGTLLIFALCELWAKAEDARLFRYQGF